MAESGAAGEDLQVQCPHCGAGLTAAWQDLDKPLACPKCGQPFDAALPRSRQTPTGRRFQFQCLRCGSVLEARSTQTGTQGRCPSCAAVFIVPQMDERTGLARTNADPGEDGEFPAPVHAYAAAGTMAPQIVRHDDDRLIILCPRCQNESPVRADNCPKCGLPFTMEGMTFRPPTGETSIGLSAVVLGVVALPLGFCGGVGILPGIVAVGLGLWGCKRPGVWGWSSARVGVGLGLIAILISIGSIASVWH